MLIRIDIIDRKRNTINPPLLPDVTRENENGIDTVGHDELQQQMKSDGVNLQNLQCDSNGEKNVNVAAKTTRHVCVINLS